MYSHIIWAHANDESGTFRPQTISSPSRFAPKTFPPWSFPPWSFRPL